MEGNSHIKRIILSASHAYLFFDRIPPLKMQIFFPMAPPTLPMAQAVFPAPWAYDTAACPAPHSSALPGHSPCKSDSPGDCVPAQPCPAHLLPPVTLFFPSCTGASWNRKVFRRGIWQNSYVSLLPSWSSAENSLRGEKINKKKISFHWMSNGFRSKEKRIFSSSEIFPSPLTMGTIPNPQNLWKFTIHKSPILFWFHAFLPPFLIIWAQTVFLILHFHQLR